MIENKNYQEALPRLERCKSNGAPIVWDYCVNASTPTVGNLRIGWEGVNAQSADIQSADHLRRVTDKICKMFG